MLPEASMREFSDMGYTVLPRVFSTREVARLRLAFLRLERRAQSLSEPTLLDGSLFVTERNPEGRLKIERIVWCGGAEPVLSRLGRAPRIVTAAAELLGSPAVDQLINQAHIKNPGDGVRFHFHQDSYHRRYGTELFTDVNGKGSFVQALTAIDAMAPGNGGLLIVPGSHRLGHIATTDGRLPEGTFDRGSAIPVELSPGDTLLLSPFTIHGSGPNLGYTPRRLFINGFASPGANRRDYPGAGFGVRLSALETAA
jgi:ectoine hydroxylase-related dioxygenase (phytanoyl-CoA dioxygenase family)